MMKSSWEMPITISEVMEATIFLRVVRALIIFMILGFGIDNVAITDYEALERLGWRVEYHAGLSGEIN